MSCTNQRLFSALEDARALLVENIDCPGWTVSASEFVDLIDTGLEAYKYEDMGSLEKLINHFLPTCAWDDLSVQVKVNSGLTDSIAKRVCSCYAELEAEQS